MDDRRRPTRRDETRRRRGAANEAKRDETISLTVAAFNECSVCVCVGRGGGKVVQKTRRQTDRRDKSVGLAFDFIG